MPGTRFTDIRRFSSIDSTNRYLLEQARAGAVDGTVAVASHQTAGRGRLGRTWEAPPGSNLLVSVLLRLDLPVGERSLIAAAVALAAVDAARVVAATDLGIKWPNDLLAPDGRKVAGVLSEADLTAASKGGPLPVVVGIGINSNWPLDQDELPSDLAGAATSLAQLAGHAVDLDALLEELLSALEGRLGGLETPRGRTGLAHELRLRCTTIGTVVRVELAGEQFEGTAVGLSPEGHLIVDHGGKARAVIAGDVVHVRPAFPEVVGPGSPNRSE
jgi:BirA family biotin operon repressor/biotin-[acetyl-CoA-carboxylase] ligase